MNHQLALIIEDDRTLSRAYQRVLSDLGYDVELCDSVSAARLHIRDLAPQLILVDIDLPDGNGLDLMDELRSSTHERFIVISGNTTQRAAIKSIRNRAAEFVLKPVSLQQLKRIIGEAVAPSTSGCKAASHEEPQIEPGAAPPKHDCWINAGSSPPLVDLRRAISFSAEQRKGHALIVGDPGLEKISIAQELHERGRRQGNIVFVDCSNRENTELVDELFGRIGSTTESESNTATDTESGTSGAIARAVGGTLVLDNVDGLSCDLQSALSMFLDTGVFKRPGTEAGFKAVVAVVGIVSEGSEISAMRTDFAARLGQVTLQIPNLRECVKDIQSIAQWMLPLTKGYRTHMSMSDAMLEQLLELPWPRNIAELRTIIQASIDEAAGCDSNTAGGKQLEFPASLASNQWSLYNDLVGLTLREFGDQLINATLIHCRGDKAKTAETLDISLKTLYNRLNSQ